MASPAAKRASRLAGDGNVHRPLGVHVPDLCPADTDLPSLNAVRMDRTGGKGPGTASAHFRATAIAWKGPHTCPAPSVSVARSRVRLENQPLPVGDPTGIIPRRYL